MVTVQPAPVLVLEGVYTGRPPLRDLVDLAVLVETVAEERRRRLTARRHGNDAWWPRWGADDDHYYYTAICPRMRSTSWSPAASRSFASPIDHRNKNARQRHSSAPRHCGNAGA